MRASTLAMESGNVFNLQDFEQNEIPLKQRSFEDSIDTFLSLFDADLLPIWMNNFRHVFRFRSASLSSLVHRADNFARGVYVVQAVLRCFTYCK